MIRGRVDGPVAGVLRRVVHPPALEQLTLGLPPTPIIIAEQQEQAFRGADKCQNADPCTSNLASGLWNLKR